MSLSAAKAFNEAAVGNPTKPRKRQRPAPFTIRLSADERAHLKRKAGNRPLATYIRAQILDQHERALRKPARAPSIDYALLGKLLGMLGQSDLVQHLCLLAVAAEAGRINVADDDRAALRSACADVGEMRRVLLVALGLKVGGTP